MLDYNKSCVNVWKMVLYLFLIGFYFILFLFLDEQKTKESLEIESSIIKEMMDIVAKRDSLIALLEEDRLRLSPNSTAPYPFSVTHLKDTTFFLLYTVFAVFIEVVFINLDIKRKQ